MLTPPPTGVGEQGLEHLGHAAALGRGVDVPDGPAVEDLAGSIDVAGKSRRPRRLEEPGEAVQGYWRRCRPPARDHADMPDG